MIIFVIIIIFFILIIIVSYTVSLNKLANTLYTMAYFLTAKLRP